MFTAGSKVSLRLNIMEDRIGINKLIMSQS